MRDSAIFLAALVVAGAAPMTAGAATGPVVVMNDNLAGCVEPGLDSYTIGSGTHLARSRCGNIAAGVDPSDRALAHGAAVYTAPRAYRKNLGYTVMPPRPLPYSETMTFPLLGRNDRLHAFYNIVLGRP